MAALQLPSYALFWGCKQLTSNMCIFIEMLPLLFSPQELRTKKGRGLRKKRGEESNDDDSLDKKKLKALDSKAYSYTILDPWFT